ncbi:PREDICTED: dnaJ homolog subfamily C member 30-like [Amphimedon queenslandica]|uniref:J domain-containing protein n=1 Tax=Amphimedon queenslandica TaxID=400682 RepID=A0A1X7VKA4_AMPQE|nr:PREDICTED: dnaJ homolog subfamily C member 30-like [Amphimedon queenslandica]|eukprot:XP_003384211.1 PREDICTED: dnaJ homolog subfamily C member 30-like [Amphimedon queenslandica]
MLYIWRTTRNVSFISSFLSASGSVAIKQDGQLLYKPPASREVLPLAYYGRHFSSSSGSKKDLYSRLGLTSKATQSQIKESYYKLSKKYHPDHNKGSQEANAKFQEITEAYSILGRNNLRRKYDKGLLREHPLPHYSSSQWDFSQAPSTRTKSTVYDFDAFYQAHYGEALRREQRARAKRAAKKESSRDRIIDAQQRMIIIGIACFLVLFAFHLGMAQYGENLKQSYRKSGKK